MTISALMTKIKKINDVLNLNTIYLSLVILLKIYKQDINFIKLKKKGQYYDAGTYIKTRLQNLFYQYFGLEN